MKTIEKYDFDEFGKERLREIRFVDGMGGLFKSYENSYIHGREEFQKMGLKMGFEKNVKIKKKVNRFLYQL
jgi:hypothetical protein